MINRDALLEVLGEILADPAGRDAETEADAILALDRPAARRHWEGEALAAFDQSLASIREGAFPPPEFWMQRAQVAAAIASAEQARIANLIAWKQLQATRQATRDFGADLMPLASADAVATEIEEGLRL